MNGGTENRKFSEKLRKSALFVFGRELLLQRLVLAQAKPPLSFSSLKFTPTNSNTCQSEDHAQFLYLSASHSEIAFSLSQALIWKIQCSLSLSNDDLEKRPWMKEIMKNARGICNWLHTYSASPLMKSIFKDNQGNYCTFLFDEVLRVLSLMLGVFWVEITS